MDLQPWQQRVVDEKVELDKKREALLKFIRSGEYEKLDVRTRELMQEQWEAMTWYSVILSSRILHFD